MPVPQRIRKQLCRLATAFFAAGLLSACQDVSDFSSGKHLTPVSTALKREIEANGMAMRSPILLRIFKEESTLEVWKEDRSGRYKLLKDYKICAWSGKPGPKIKEGDRQAPEGFYTVTPGQMNPNSSYYLSFNIGFPNAFDRSLGRTGTHIMVHGDCSSRGCYAMEDEGIEEIYTLAREAFAGGQRGFQVQAFPFRMTPENLATHADSEHLDFWKMLKEGSDHFEVTGRSPKVDVCGRKYVFDAKPEQAGFRATEACPAYKVEEEIERLVAVKRDADTEKMNLVIAQMDAKEERERRWAEREQAVAAFFGGGATGTGDGDTIDGGAVAVALGVVPVPKRAPGGPNRTADGVAVASVAAILSPRTGGSAGGRSIVAPSSAASLLAPGPAGRGMSATGKSTAAAAAMAAAPSGAARPAAGATVAAAGPASAAPKPQSPEADAAALGFAAVEEDGGGFLSSVAKSSQGLFRRAGSLF